MIWWGIGYSILATVIYRRRKIQGKRTNLFLLISLTIIATIVSPLVLGLLMHWATANS